MDTVLKLKVVVRRGDNSDEKYITVSSITYKCTRPGMDKEWSIYEMNGENLTHIHTGFIRWEEVVQELNWINDPCYRYGGLIRELGGGKVEVTHHLPTGNEVTVHKYDGINQKQAERWGYKIF